MERANSPTSSMPDKRETSQQGLEAVDPEGKNIAVVEDTSTSPNDDTTQYPSGLHLTLIILSLCVSVFLVALDQTIIAPALGAITTQFASIKDIGCPPAHVRQHIHAL
ncbi:hypothetical protein N0V85_008850 [Neurospora sp. IMI 360204]|nr:hypothetical protein N0V85_008850 [Neurospora sp. IMI 360204]